MRGVARTADVMASPCPWSGTVDGSFLSPSVSRMGRRPAGRGLGDGSIHEGRYVEGKRHGKWVRRGGAGGCLTLVLVVVAMVFLVGC